MESPVKSRDVLLLPDFSGKQHAKTCHIMGGHRVSRHSNGKRRKKCVGLHWNEQYCLCCQIKLWIYFGSFNNLDVLTKLSISKYENKTNIELFYLKNNKIFKRKIILLRTYLLFILFNINQNQLLFKIL